MLRPGSRWRKVAQMALGTGILQAANLITYIALARLLVPEDYGTYRQLFVISQLVWGIVFAALPSTLLYFGGRASSESETAGVIRLHFRLVVGLAALVATGLFVTRGLAAQIFANRELAHLLVWFAAYPAAQMLVQLVPPVLVLLNRTSIMPAYTSAVAVSMTGAVVGAAWLCGQLESVVLAATLAGLLCAAGGAVLVVRSTRDPAFPSITAGNIASYGWPLLMAAGISLVGLRLDHVAVSHVLGPAIYAVYAIGAFEIPIYSLIKSSSGSVALPEISRHAQNGAWQDVLEVWRDVQRRNGALIFPLSAFFFAFAEPLVTLVFGARYREAAPVFAIFALLAPVRFVAFNTIMRATGKTRSDLLASTIFLATLAAIIWPAAAQYGLQGAAIAVVGSTYLMAFLMLALTRRATERQLSISSLYPPRLIISFVLGVAGLWLVAEGASAFVPPSGQLALGGMTTALTIVLYLRRPTILTPAPAPE
jgi:O-antigen/teichoic acid export membrane protein